MLRRCAALWLSVVGAACFLSPSPARAGSLDLQWDGPTTNADGSVLADLAGYRVYRHTSPPTCPGAPFQFVPAGDPSPATPEPAAATLTGLQTGVTYWVRVSAVDLTGIEGECTPAVSGVAQPDGEVTPSSLDFGPVSLGSSGVLDLTVQNLGGTALRATATAAAPFSIVAPSTVSVPAGQSRVVKVRFAPLTVTTFAGHVDLVMGGDDVSIGVTGAGVTATPAVLKLSQAALTVTEGGTVTLTVTRSGGMHGGVAVDYATSNGSAGAGSDYVAAGGTLTFAAGQTSRTFTVRSLQDADGEGPETLSVELGNPTGGATLGTPSAATVTINDDEPSVRFSAATYTVAEAAGLATITVTRVGGTGSAVSVSYGTTAAGTATAGPGGDFTPVSGTLSFAAGQLSRTFTVPILDDDVADGPKTVGLALTGPSSGSTLGVPATAVLTITDGDVAGTVQFGAAQYVADEGGGTFRVPVTRTGGTAAGVTAVYTITGGSATLGVDFTLGGTGTVTFDRGVVMVPISIDLTPDAPREGPDTLELTLSAPGGGATLGVIRRTTVTIDEVAFQFAPAVYAVAEGGTAAVTVTRTGPVGRSVTVEWTTGDGTARAGEDYTAAAGTLTFPVGVRTQAVAVRTVHDTLVEGAETVLLRLRNPSAGTTLGAQSTAVVTITDNDAGGRIFFAAASHLVAESRGTYPLTVVRTGGAAGNVSVRYSVTGGTATGAGVDYTLAAGTLTFAAGQTSAVIPVPVVDDGVAEANETVLVALSDPTGGATLGTPASAMLTLTDDDRTATVQFGAAAYTVAEGVGSAVITLTRTGTATAAVSVDVATSDGTATAGTDYTAVTTTVTFGVGVTSRTVAVPILANGGADGSRTVGLTLSGATAPAALGALTTAVLTIQDDDSTLAFGAPTYTVAEGGTAAVTVRRTGSLIGTVSVGYAVTGGTAGSGTDYAPLTGRLTFGAGIASQTLAVRTLVDAAVEGDETIQLALSAPAGSATVGTPATATVTITDNPPIVKFGAAAYTVTEGTATATLTVVRSGPTTGTVTVDYARVGGTATGGGTDSTDTPGTLTFGPGVTSRTFTVGIVNDALPEGPETVVFGLSGASGAVVGAPATTTLTINDDEPQVRFAAAAYTVSEVTPVLTVTVVRTGPTAGPVTVGYEVTGGTATAAQDYTLNGTGTLTFGPGVTIRTFTVGIVNDTLAEGPETVVLALSGASGAVVGTPATTTLTIQDNEPQVRFAVAGYAVSEAAPVLTVTVVRTGPTTGPVTVSYGPTGGTATAGQDYTVNGTGTLTFAAGVTTQGFTVALTDDTRAEPGETIALTLSAPVGATLGTPSVATVSVASNDVAGAVQLASATHSASEGSGAAIITLVRQGGAASAVTVDVATVDGSAVAGTHYTAVATTVTFAAGQTTATVTVPLVDDGEASEGRWLGLELIQPGGGATLGALRSALVWIVDDD